MLEEESGMMGVIRESLGVGQRAWGSGNRDSSLGSVVHPWWSHGESRAHAWLHMAMMRALPLTRNLNTFAS